MLCAQRKTPAQARGVIGARRGYDILFLQLPQNHPWFFTGSRPAPMLWYSRRPPAHTVVIPGLYGRAQWWRYRHIAKVQCQLTFLVAFVGPTPATGIMVSMELPGGRANTDLWASCVCPGDGENVMAV